MNFSSDKSMKALRVGLFVLLWFGALYGVLKSGPLFGRLGISRHGLCGPWGCGPPTEAILVCHGFWFIFLGGAALLVNSLWCPATLRGVGMVLLCAGFATGIAILGWEVAHWAPGMRPYAVQRLGFVFITWTDLPVIQTVGVGLFLLLSGRRRRRLAPASCEGLCGEKPHALHDS